jgi:hypothetical protein
MFGFKSIHQGNIYPLEDPSLLVYDPVTGPVFPTVWRGFCSFFFIGQTIQEVEGIIDLYNVRNYWLYSTLSHPGRLKSLVTLPWEPQMSNFSHSFKFHFINYAFS